MNSLKKLAVLAVALLLTFGAVAPADAQALASSPATVSLSYSIGETINIAPSTGTANFDPITLTTPSYTVTTSWSLLSTRTKVNVNFGFQSGVNAMVSGTSSIPSSSIFLNVNSLDYNNCTQAAGADSTLTALLTPGAICNAGALVPIGSGNYSGNVVTSFVLQLRNLPISLAAGTYTGTMVIVADAV